MTRTRVHQWEDDYKRATFFVEKDLLEKINELSIEKGDKTKIINEALKVWIAIEKIKKEGRD